MGFCIIIGRRQRRAARSRYRRHVRHAADTGLQEVVVTARRFSENLQNVPLAVTAIGAAAIQTQDVTNLEDLNSFVPNFKISADRATSSTINVYIRGVGQSDPLWGNEPGVGVYIDDVYLARPQTALLDVIDVQDLEILRGPQGTLYGKNTIAGAIKYVTRDIDGPATLTVSATGGNYGEHDEKLNFSTPVIDDHVYFGLALAQLHHDGYGQVVAQPGAPPSPSLGEDVSNKDVLAGRANLTIKWGESSKLRIIADDTLDNSNASGGQRLNNYLAPQLSDPFDTRTDMPVNNDYSHRSGESATYTQSLTDQLGLKVVAGYIEGKSQQFIDFEELDSNLFQVPGLYHDQQASGEAQLTFKNDLVNAVGGVFYMDSTACGAYNASIGTLSGTLPPTVAPDLGVYITELVEGCVLTKSSAVYGDTSWKLTDQLNLDAGLRWNEDEKTAHVYQADYASVAPTQLLPDQQFFNPAAVPAGFFPFPGVVTDYTGNRTFVNFTPRLGLDYHLTPQVMAYVSYSRGFKSGGFDMRGNAAVYPQTENGYNSETADNYEAGIKSTLLDDTLLLNLTGVLRSVQECADRRAAIRRLQGRTDESHRGAQCRQADQSGRRDRERVAADHALTLGLNAGYLDSYYKDFLIPCNVFTLTPGCGGSVAVVNVADANRPINAPAWTAIRKCDLHLGSASGTLLARAGLRLAQLHQSRGHLPEPDRSAGVRPAQRRCCVHHLEQVLALLDRRQESHQPILPGRRLRLSRAADRPRQLFIGGVSQIGYYGPPRTYSGTVTYHF